jgi:hypothetical protein
MKSKEASSAVMSEPAAAQRTQNLADQEPFPPGAVIRGKVLCRTRRQTKAKDGRTLFIISLSILASHGIFEVQRWAEEAMPKELPVVGQQVELPVRISAYLQSGVPKVRLVWEDGQISGAF